MSRVVRDVLICGGSIAGPTLAWWLQRQGFRAALLEKAPAPRPGRHAVDICGTALDVIHAIGLEQPVRAAWTQMEGVSKLDVDGNEVWRSEEMTIVGGSFDTRAIEIIREDLSRIFIDAVPPEFEPIYGDSIRSLRDDGEPAMARAERAVELSGLS